MIELRPFAKLGGADHGWLKAKHHFSFGSHYDPDNMGHGSLAGVERRRDRAEHRLSRPSPCQHGNHHLCPRRRDHPSGIARQQGPHRSRRRAGDERGLRHPPRRVQSGADEDQDLPDLDRADDARAASRPGAQSRSRSRIAPASSSPSPAALQATSDALPIRADARVLATTLKAGESAEYEPRQGAQSLSGAGGRQRRSQRRARQRPRRRRDPRRGEADDHRTGRYRTGAGRRGVKPSHPRPSCPGLSRASTPSPT